MKSPRLDEYVKITMEKQYDGDKTTQTFDTGPNAPWSELLTAFTYMLRGAGYTIDGSFELADNEESE